MRDFVTGASTAVTGRRVAGGGGQRSRNDNMNDNVNHCHLQQSNLNCNPSANDPHEIRRRIMEDTTSSSSPTKSSIPMTTNNNDVGSNDNAFDATAKSSQRLTINSATTTTTTLVANPYAKLPIANPYTATAKTTMASERQVVAPSLLNNFNYSPPPRRPPPPVGKYQQHTRTNNNDGPSVATIENNPMHNELSHFDNSSNNNKNNTNNTNNSCNNNYSNDQGRKNGFSPSHASLYAAEDMRSHFASNTNNKKSSSTFIEGPIPICPKTKHNWIYPLDDKYPERLYQLQISHSAIIQNTLVSLPTGLGKTLIAAVVMYNYYRWYPAGKIVFCAPTRPLVSQQIVACYNIMGIPERHTAEISGRTKPENRAAMWTNKRVFFCTPQTLVKDISDNRCDASNIVCVVMDEAHRATGEHANSVLIRLITNSGAKFRLVGLSATPGTDIKSIQAVCTKLQISRIESRAEDDPDVSRYIHHREEEVIIVKQPDVVKVIDTQFAELILPILTRLREEKVSPRLHYDSATLSNWNVTLANKEYVERTGDYRLNSQFNILRELVTARMLLKEHGVQMARTKLVEAANKPFMNYIARQSIFQSLIRDMSSAASGGSGGVGGGGSTTENNPKLIKLVEVLREHFERKEAVDGTNNSTRAIVFSQWRESVGEIVRMLTLQNLALLKPAQFIGQASKKAVVGGSKKTGGSSTSYNTNTGQDTAGMNQAQQQRVLQQFGDGIFNILVCTCVGEEGLDIGDVDLIVNYDVMKSPIRSIQRNGRTGRKRNGRVVFLVAEHEEKKYRESVMNSNKISRALRDPSVFKLCTNIPMFQNEPELLRKKLNVKSFRLSQVGGHTPKSHALNGTSKEMRGGIKKKKTKTRKRVENNIIDTNWRLDPIEESERISLFGHLPHSSCRDYEVSSNKFPLSLKRKYLISRTQSIYMKMVLKGQGGRVVMSKGTSSTIVKELEAICAGNNLRDGRFRLHECSTDTRANDARIDLTDDCASINFDSHVPENETSKSFSPDISLTAIFGPIVTVRRDIGINPLQMASLFDAEYHRNCAVHPPPGMTLYDSSKEESDSASSTISESSFNNNDDLCAFFDNIKTSDLGVQSGPKSHIPLEMTPHSEHDFDVDVDVDENYLGTTYQIYEDNSTDPGFSDEGAITSGGGIDVRPQSSEQTGEEKNRGLNDKENVNTQSPLSSARQQNHSLALSATKRQNLLYEEIAETVNCMSQNMSHENEHPHAGVSCLYHDDVHLSSQNQGSSPVLETSFCLSTPPPSSDEEEVSSKNEKNSPVLETSFCLPTPPPSSDEDEDDSSENESEIRNRSVCTHNDALAVVESHRDDLLALLEEETIQNEENAMNTTFFQLQTQYSSSEVEDDDDDDDDVDGSETGACATTNNLPHDEANNAITTATSDHTIKSLNSKVQVHTDLPLTNSSESQRAIFKTAPSKELTDTPPIKARTSQHPRMSLESLTDTPLHPRQSRKIHHQRKSLESLTDTPVQHPKSARQQRKRLRAALERCNSQNADKEVVDNVEMVPEKERVRKRIEEKYRCKFLDGEAANDDSDESDEDETLRQIEDEEMSHDSFINDTSQLGYTQDDLDCVTADAVFEDCEPATPSLHRQIYHQHEVDNQMATPILNRRMRNTKMDESQDTEQKGLGNMNFIRSVLEYHRSGGDAEELEDEFHRLAGANPNSNIDSPISMQVKQPTTSCNVTKVYSQTTCNRTVSNNVDASNNMENMNRDGLGSQNFVALRHSPPVIVPVELTTEQQAMIEAKRVEALRRRQLRMQQQQQQQQQQKAAAPFNPYAKK